jgi:hypothetical protein
MRLALLALVAASASPALSAERTFNVAPFEEILLAGSMDVAVTTGRAISVVADGSADALDRLDIRTEGNRLIIGHKRGMQGSWSENSPTVRVSVPRISAATISGSGDMVIDKVDAPAFTGRISGSGDLAIGNLRAGPVELSTSGSGDMRAAGRCAALTTRISGSGDMMLAGLTCETVDATVNGSGNITVNATKSGNLATNGSGDIKVSGGAKCSIRKSGSGSIVCG